MTTGSPDALRVTDNPDRKRFEGYLDDELVGIVEYIPLSGKIIATHTEVLTELEGQGIGSQLAAGVLAQLRADGRLVQPLCPYLSAYLQRHPEWSDVVDQTTPH
jgi:uncharacterized protein